MININDILYNINKINRDRQQKGLKRKPYYYDPRPWQNFIIFSGFKFTLKGIYFIGIYIYKKDNNFISNPEYLNVTKEFTELNMSQSFINTLEAIKKKLKKRKVSNAKFENVVPFFSNITTNHKQKYKQVLEKKLKRTDYKKHLLN